MTPTRMSGAIDLAVGVDRRILRDHVDALDDGVGRGERDVGCAQRIDREEADVPGLRLQPFDHLARLLIAHELDRHAEAAGELARQVGGDAAGFGRRRIARGEHGIAEIDRGAQRARGSQVGRGGGKRVEGRHGSLTVGSKGCGRAGSRGRSDGPRPTLAHRMVAPTCIASYREATARSAERTSPARGRGSGARRTASRRR